MEGGGRELEPNINTESETITYSKFKIKEEPQDIDEDGWYISTNSDSDSSCGGDFSGDEPRTLEVKLEEDPDKETSTDLAKGIPWDIEGVWKDGEKDNDRENDEEWQVSDANERYLHRDLKPVSCQSCHKAFWNSALFKEHLIRHHKGKTVEEESSCNSAELEKRAENRYFLITNPESHSGMEGHYSVDSRGVKSFESNKSQTQTCSLENDKNDFDGVTSCHCISDSSNKSSYSFCEFVNVQAMMKIVSKQKSYRFLSRRATSTEERESLFGTSPVKPFPCELCPKSFSQKRLLDSHLNTHKRREERKCPVCQRSFTRISKLNRHLEIHDSQNQCPDEAIRCHICQKTFSRVNNLKRHVLIHSGEKSYRCEICNRSFSDKSSLRNHQYTHTKEKAFRCEICRSRFKQKRCLVRHMANAHVHHKQRK